MSTKQLLIGGGIFVMGASLGFGAGYLVYKKKFQRIADEEIESVRTAYSKATKLKPNISEIVRKVDLAQKKEVLTEDEAIIYNQGYASGTDVTDAEAFRETNGRAPSTYELIQMGQGVSAEDAVRNSFDHDDSSVTEGNIFDDPPEQDPEDLGEGVNEIPPRSFDRPYVIEVSDWYLNETNYDQITLTYWADDNVLADDADRMITEVEKVVGTSNLHRFGFQSENPDIVYVRNDQQKVDYEITKDERNYGEVVRNGDTEESRPNGAPRRMRSNDE